jgi:two-component system, LuxR family, response regulator FixJ
MNHRPTVFIVDPDAGIRKAVHNLASSMDLDCEEYVSGQEFLKNHDPLRPGCVVLEIRVPGVNGLQIQQTLVELGSPLPILFLTTQPSVSIAIHAMRSGAMHFFEKPFREHDLWTALQEAVQLNQLRLVKAERRKATEELLANLTVKEVSVLEMLGEGKTKRLMALELGVSVRTIEHYRTQLMRKLKTNSLAGILRTAVFVKENYGAINGHHPQPDHHRAGANNGNGHHGVPPANNHHHSYSQSDIVLPR